MKGKFASEFFDWMIITVSILIVAAGTYYFKFPNNFSFGGVTGLAVIIGKMTPWSPSVVTLALNAVLLIVGFVLLGKSFGIKTVYASILLSVAMWAMEKLYPLSAPLTNEPLLELAFAVFLPAFGSAILFHVGSSSGGTDIIAMIVQKYTGMELGGGLFASDFLITLSSCFVFGIETGLYSFLGLMMKSLAVDSVIVSINLCKYFTVVCDNPEPICNFITHELKKSATYEQAKGAYSGQKKYVIFTVLKRPQALQLRNFIKKTEPTAFMMITNTSEIIGKGFRQSL